jgi:hypothetical protein
VQGVCGAGWSEVGCVREGLGLLYAAEWLDFARLALDAAPPVRMLDPTSDSFGSRVRYMYSCVCVRMCTSTIRMCVFVLVEVAFAW